MAHVNNFERDLESKKRRETIYRRDAVEVYKYDGTARDLLDNIDDISDFITHHIEAQRPRLQMLDDYYQGLNYNVMRSDNRRREKHLADNRVAHDFASYIADFINGYCFGHAIQVQSEKEMTQNAINSLHDINDIDSHNRSIGLDLSIFGRAYEYIIRNQDDEVRIYKTNAKDTFVIYDTTVQQNSIAAVRYWKVSEDKDIDMYHIDFITDQATYFFVASKSTNLKISERKPPELHSFGKVTVTEFSNNEKRRGDFEKVIPLIDLYDNAQSDTANYMSDLNDAMLLIKGNIDLGDENVVRLQKEANVFHLDPPQYEDADQKVNEGNVDAEYIYKQYDVNGVESYKDRISRNIHMFTNTPDMTDENFSGNQSGEAMKYKLFGLEQRTAIKEGLFRKGLRRRYKLIGEIMSVNRELDKDNIKDLVFTFTRNLPKSLTEEMQMYVNAGGEISQKTLMSLVSFIDNPQQEAERIKQEQEEKIKHSDELMFNDLTDNPQMNEDSETSDNKE
ncbi:phage portal protein [Staphylococcus epidermidis]|nr:phage portal protein [Staphylococcus epidermidis]MDH8773785.1 phage portal protein [Staphylococcus epidermidis]MDH8818056.1 phage portal protein [Staphylococcus epidermidis]MDH8845039.1 phage portal protein [Staphylococcus epidermidis]MDH8862760.1 phage portal protein [Staphylococcus epidermidis]